MGQVHLEIMNWSLEIKVLITWKWLAGAVAAWKWFAGAVAAWKWLAGAVAACFDKITFLIFDFSTFGRGGRGLF